MFTAYRIKKLSGRVFTSTITMEEPVLPERVVAFMEGLEDALARRVQPKLSDDEYTKLVNELVSLQTGFKD